MVIGRFLTYKEMNGLAEELGYSRTSIENVYYGRKENERIYNAIVERAKENCKIASKELWKL